MKKTILFLAILFLPATGFGQNLPSWAEPSEDRSFGEHPTEKRAPDVSQREGLNGLSGGRGLGATTWNDNGNKGGNSENNNGRGSAEACNGIINGNGNSNGCKMFCKHNPENLQCRKACAVDSDVECSEPIPIDNPFAIGFLVALGFVYAYIKL